MKIIDLIEGKIKKNKSITFEEAMEIAKSDDEKQLEAVFELAERIKRRFKGKAADLCSIMNVKSGRCSEDCKFCAQSKYYRTGIDAYGLAAREKILEKAQECERCGVNRFSLVASGKGLKAKEFQEILSICEELKGKTALNLCVSFGILNFEQLSALKRAGVSRYHHNLETSREYYGAVCTTHSYQERIDTINLAAKAGLEVCSGGIMGMGEAVEDRVRLAFELKELNVKSIPINILNPIKGTPFENMRILSNKEVMKIVAVFRLINPDAHIRLAGGRNLLEGYGRDCFKAGASAAITGNYLTTAGNKIKDDIEMIKLMGMEVLKDG